MRRLLLVNLLCIVAFTRNPSWLRVLRKVDTFSNPGNTERFRVFYEILPPIIGGFASLRARLGFQLLLLLRVCLCVRRIAVSQNWLTRRQRYHDAPEAGLGREVQPHGRAAPAA